ncbi:MAG: cobalamin-dependent protein [Pirellulales bacterium]|nr:cobalamin-dependent protein [Pirellulales bacterium]
MHHIAFVPFVGFRVCSAELREIGFTMPSLRHRGVAVSELPALGVLTLAGMMPGNWTSSYHPARASVDELVEQVIAQRPTIVAISALTASIDEASQFSQSIRRAGLKTVLGGLHATTCADDVEEHFDAVVIGNGERVWPSVVRDAERGSVNRRYSAPNDSTPFHWPMPRFDLLGDRVPRYTLQTERGCPLACDFCAASRLLGSFREKPAANVAAELAAINQFAPQPLIELADDNTFAGRRDPRQLCELLAASNARWFTECDWRIGERPLLLAQMAAAGCVQVLVGIESLVFRYPGMGAKRTELARIITAIEAIQEAGIVVNACFIVGADGETSASIERLVEFLLQIPAAEVQLTLQTPFPGTALRRRLLREGRLLAHRGWRYYTLLDATFHPDLMTVDELEQKFRWAVEQVYSIEARRSRNVIRREVWQRNPSLRKHRSIQLTTS